MVYALHSNSRSPTDAMMIPKVMTNTERTTVCEGAAFFKMRTLRARETMGVHLLMAPYMGMFIPCKAYRLRADRDGSWYGH